MISLFKTTNVHQIWFSFLEWHSDSFFIEFQSSQACCSLRTPLWETRCSQDCFLVISWPYYFLSHLQAYSVPHATSSLQHPVCPLQPNLVTLPAVTPSFPLPRKWNFCLIRIIPFIWHIIPTALYYKFTLFGICSAFPVTLRQEWRRQLMGGVWHQRWWDSPVIRLLGSGIRQAGFESQVCTN